MQEPKKYLKRKISAAIIAISIKRYWGMWVNTCFPYYKTKRINTHNTTTRS